MNETSSNLDREVFIFTKHVQQSHSRFFLTEEEYFTVTARPHSPGIQDAVVLSLGNWLIKLGTELKTRSVYTQLSEKRA